MSTNIRDKLLSEGYSAQEIDEAIAPLQNQLLSEGYSQQEVNEAFGKPEFDNTEIKDFIENVGSDEPEESEGLFEAFQAGIQASSGGLAARGELPDIKLPDDPSFSERIAAGVGHITGDAPAMVGGALAGFAGGPVTSMAGAFAMPAGIRKVLMDSYTKGSIDSPQEFMSRLRGTMTETGKGWLIGASTGAAGAGASRAAKLLFGANSTVVAGSAKIGAEVSTMVTASAALDGRAPTKEEFIDAAVLLGGVKASMSIAGGIRNTMQQTFVRTGKQPNDVIRDSKVDQTIKEDIIGGREIPRSYEKVAKDSQIGFTPKQKAQLPEERVKARISTVNENIKNKLTADDVYTAFISKLHPLKKAVDAITEGKKLSADKDPFVAATLSQGIYGKTHHFLEFGTFKHKTLEVTGPGLKKILQPVGKDLDNFRAYMVAKRTVEVASRGKETGISLLDAKATVAKFEAKYAKTFDQVKTYQAETLNYLKDAGILSDKQIKSIRSLNNDYVPLYRVLEPTSEKGAKGITVFNPVRSLKGSQKEIIDPLESIIKNTYAFMTIAERNSVAAKFAELSKLPKGQDFIKKVKPKLNKVTVSEKELAKITKDPKSELDIFRPGFNKTGKGEFVVFENGKAKIYQTDPVIADIINGLNKDTSNLLIRMLSTPASLTRAGITLSPDFMVKNVLRDNIIAGIQSKNGFVPFVDGIRGLSSIIKKDDAYTKWLRSGGANSALVSLDRNYIQDSLYSVLQTGKVRNQITKPLEMLRVLGELNDSVSRVGEFKKAIKANPEDTATLLKGAYASREISMDFARKGAQTQALNKLSAFFNARIGGVDRFVRAIKDNPAQTSAKIAAFIMMPEILLWYANREDERYQNLPEWEKAVFMHVLTDEHIYRIPRAFEPGVLFGRGTSLALEAMYEGKDAEEINDDFLKLVGNSGLMDVSSLVPNVIQPFIANYTNTNLFTGSPVIPSDREKLLPAYQYTHYTNELTKAASRILVNFTDEDTKQLTPVGIDNFIRSWGGTLGVMISDSADYALRKAGALPDPERSAKTLEEMPMIKAFMTKYPSMNTKNMEEFYESYNKNQKSIQTFRKLIKEEGNIGEAFEVYEARQAYFNDLNDAKRAIGNLTKFIKYVEFNQSISAEEKRQAIDSAYFQANQIAEFANEQAKQWEKIIKEKENK